jgi:5-methylcytosine-specific restriction endonuclease McrA
VKLREWGKAIRERDGACQICGAVKFLNAHHILPKEYYKEHMYDLKNGITLCAGKCHRFGKYSAHKNSIFFAKWLQENKPEIYQWILKRL